MFEILIFYFWVFYSVAFCAALIGWGIFLAYITAKCIQSKKSKKNHLLIQQLRQQNKPSQLWW